MNVTSAALRKLFSFLILLAAMLVAGAFASTRWRGIAVGKLFAQGDTWWHLAVGERILATGVWPTSDPYSCTMAGADWIAYEWLGEIGMAAAARIGGLLGLAALLVGLSSVMILLLAYYAYLRCRNFKAAVVSSALLLPLAAALFTLRPQLIGWIFALVTLICLEHYRQGRPKYLWLLPALFLLWVNTHGTFVFGFLFLGVFLLSSLLSFRVGSVVAVRSTPQQRRQLLVSFLVCALVLPLTPYGTRSAAYPLEIAFFQPLNLASVTEWYPIDFAQPHAKVFLGLLLLFLLAQLVLQPLMLRLEDVALLVIAICAACLHRRLIIFFALVFAPILAELLARWVPRYEPEKDHPALNACLLLLIGWGIAGFFPTREALARTLKQSYPQGALEYLSRHPVQGCLLNEVTWGGYLIWAGGSPVRTFMDGRADVHEYGGILEDYVHIMRLESQTLPLLRRHAIQACLLERASPVGTLLESQPDWVRVYEDELSVIYARRSSAIQQPGERQPALARPDRPSP